MPDTATDLKYGDTFGIVQSMRQGDRRRVAAVEPRPDNTAAPQSPPPPVRYACFDEISGESAWRILDNKGHPKSGPVKYGDAITLATSAWIDGNVKTLYLSCLFNNSLSGDPSRYRVGLYDQPLGNETWTIFNPDDPASIGKAVTRLGTFALRCGDQYLSQQITSGPRGDRTTHVLHTVRSAGEAGKWIVGPVVTIDAKPLLPPTSKSWVTVLWRALGDNYHHLSAAADTADIDTAPGDRAANIQFDASPLSDLSRWRFEQMETRYEQVPLRFGDSIYLGVVTYKDPAEPKTRYLQYLANREPPAVGVALPSGGRAWERWKIVDPKVPDSRAVVRYGDDFALQGLDGAGRYLSVTQDWPGAGTTSSTLGERETFIVADPSREVGDVKPPAVPPPSESAAMLVLSENMTKKAVGTLAKTAGKFGGEIAFDLLDHFGVFGKDGGTDIWALIKAQVKAVVRQAIQDQSLATLQDKLTDLDDAKREYDATITEGYQKDMIRGVIRTAALAVGEASTLCEQTPERALPYFVALATIHLSALRHEFAHLPAYHTDIAAADITRRRHELKGKITEYTAKLRQYRAKALEWRRNLYDGIDRYICVDYRSGQPDRGAVTAFTFTPGGEGGYRYQVAEIFGSQLDAATQSSRLWQYMDPDEIRMPDRVRATLVTGPYGKFGPPGGLPWANPNFFWGLPSGGRLGCIVLQGTKELVSGMSVWDDQQRGGIIFGQPWQKNLLLGKNERITRAKVFAGELCHGLGLETNQDQTIEVGRMNDNNKELETSWTVTLPPETHPSLKQVSGLHTATSGSLSPRLYHLYLHWDYEMWA